MAASGPPSLASQDADSPPAPAPAAPTLRLPFRAVRPNPRHSLPGIAFPPCGFSHSSLCGLRPCPYGVAPFRVKERVVRHLPGETFRRKHGRNRGCAPPLGGSPTRSPVGFRPTGPRHKDGAPYPPPGHGRPSRGCGRRPVAGSLPAHRLPVLALGLPALGDRPTASGPGPCRGRLVALRTSPPAAPPTRHGEIVGPFADLRSAPPLQSETLRWPIAAGGLPFGNALFPLRSLL